MGSDESFPCRELVGGVGEAMKREQVTWVCPSKGCGYETVQSASIKQVWHECGRGRRTKKLVCRKVS